MANEKKGPSALGIYIFLILAWIGLSLCYRHGVTSPEGITAPIVWAYAGYWIAAGIAIVVGVFAILGGQVGAISGREDVKLALSIPTAIGTLLLLGIGWTMQAPNGYGNNDLVTHMQQRLTSAGETELTIPDAVTKPVETVTQTDIPTPPKGKKVQDIWIHFLITGVVFFLVTVFVNKKWLKALLVLGFLFWATNTWLWPARVGLILFGIYAVWLLIEPWLQKEEEKGGDES